MRFLVGLMGTLLLRGVAAEPTSPAHSLQACSVVIQSPVNGEKVRGRGTVRGVAEIPPEGFLWVLVRHQGLTGWWPQGGGARHIMEGHWNAYVTYGVPGELGFFEVAVAVVDAQADEILRRWVQEAPPEYPPTPFPNVIGQCPIQMITVEKVGD